jgi:ribosomal protein L17
MKAEAAEPSVASVLRQLIADESPIRDDWTAELIQRALAWQIEQMEMKPSKNIITASVRARDARTMTELVRTLEKLDAVTRRREAKGRKSKPRDDTAIKEEFIRRLDQLLAVRSEGSSPGKPEPG